LEELWVIFGMNGLMMNPFRERERERESERERERALLIKTLNLSLLPL
jgi:hypothetical protein